MIDLIIGNYKREIENLQWHLDTNLNLNKDLDERVYTRIKDRENFIADLERIKLYYEDEGV